MIRRVLITLALAATAGLAVGACNNTPASSPALSPVTEPSEAAPSMEAPSMEEPSTPAESEMPSAS